MWSSGVFGYLLDYLLWWVLFLSLVAHTWCFFRFFPQQSRPKSALILGNALVFACFLGIAAIAGESYLRFFSVRTDSFGVSLPARRWFLLYTELNSLGFRDREWSISKPEGSRRIAFVGDSFTYGWGIENTYDRFADLVQTRFDETTPGKVEVMNVAKAGWGTRDELAATAGLLSKYAVDEVVLCYVLNDIEALVPKPEGYDPTRPPDPVLFNPDASCLVDHIYRRIYLPRLPSIRRYFDWLEGGYSDAVVWDEQRALFRQMGELCRDHGVIFRAALLPDAKPPDVMRQRELLKQVTVAFQEAGAEVVDVSVAIAELPADSLTVNAIDPHPNERAHRLFADRIWDEFYAHP